MVNPMPDLQPGPASLAVEVVSVGPHGAVIAVETLRDGTRTLCVPVDALSQLSKEAIEADVQAGVPK